jgi:hypothetical protein
MSHPVFWPTKSFFYPVGNTSPSSLLQHVPPNDDADILLLGCGDPRNILFSVYSSAADEGELIVTRGAMRVEVTVAT